MREIYTADFTGDPLETAQKASLLVTCFWCERIHLGKQPLSVCSACAARHSTLRSRR